MTHWKEGRGNLFALGWPVSHAHHSGFLHWVLQPQCWGWLKMLVTLALFSQRLPWYYGGGYFKYRFQRNCDDGNWMLAELLPCTIYVKTPYAFWLQGSNMFSCSTREFYHVWTCLWLLFARPTSLAVLCGVCPQWVSMGFCPPDLPNDPPPGVAATVLGLVKDVGHPGTVFPTIAVILRRRLLQLSFSKKLC